MFVCLSVLDHLIAIHSFSAEKVAFSATCFELVACTSHKLSFVACISRFFAFLVEFEVFVVCSRNDFHT